MTSNKNEICENCGHLKIIYDIGYDDNGNYDEGECLNSIWEYNKNKKVKGKHKCSCKKFVPKNQSNNQQNKTLNSSDGMEQTFTSKDDKAIHCTSRFNNDKPADRKTELETCSVKGLIIQTDHEETQGLVGKATNSSSVPNQDEEILTMEDKCFVCKKKQRVNEPFIILELENGHISFCSEKCEKIHYNYGRDMMKMGENKGFLAGKEAERKSNEEEIEKLKKDRLNQQASTELKSENARINFEVYKLFDDIEEFCSSNRDFETGDIDYEELKKVLNKSKERIKENIGKDVVEQQLKDKEKILEEVRSIAKEKIKELKHDILSRPKGRSILGN